MLFYETSIQLESFMYLVITWTYVRDKPFRVVTVYI